MTGEGSTPKESWDTKFAVGDPSSLASSGILVACRSLTDNMPIACKLLNIFDPMPEISKEISEQQRRMNNRNTQCRNLPI